jgi:DNA-binding CsgD family transcriptional regulator
VRTVDTHRRNLLEKLQAKNTAGLVKYAIEKGLV